ncbi:MAG TPA: filamentous hemagglutinin N-terminal domain-containing protein, partial [Burkholderiales bacterium]|nr:filamentous hemagglutinin N-terminal domain-containing protein [Burkholderiales bacterium]
MKRNNSTIRSPCQVWGLAQKARVALAGNVSGAGRKTCVRGTPATPAPKRNLLATAVVLAFMPLAMPPAQAGPTGGQVVSGSGSISQSGSTTNIQQSSQNLSLNWQTFNIGAPETVNFLQPSSSAIAVNRIFDINGSQIFGHLNANGQIYLINPNGILFGQGAQVNVGGLVASTLDLNDASLNGPTRTFSGNGTGSVVNQGTINAANGGYVALLGNTVRNEGVITAQLGTVALGAGSAATLTFNGDSLVKMQVDQSVLNALAENGGLIRADGGTVLMSARAKDALLASVVNNTGVIEARTVENVNGTIVLDGGDSGVVSVTGSLDASGTGAGQTGGTVKVLGDKVGLFDNASVNVSGDAGGGTALIGGDLHGVGTESNANAVFMGLNASITADAITSGNGGKVVLWSDGFTSAHGTIYARGGAQSGNGGLIETSGHQILDATGVRGGAGAPNGLGGTWLFDPDSNVTICSFSLFSCPFTTPSMGISGGVFSPNSNSSIILNTDINDLLNGATDVTVTTSNGTGSQPGDITVANAITHVGGGAVTLTLDAGTGGGAGSVIVNALITATDTSNPLNVVLRANNAGGGVRLNNGGNITTFDGNVQVLANTGGVTQDVGNVVDAGAGTILINGGGGTINMAGLLTTTSNGSNAVTIRNATSAALGN